jgi:hypothetical protein
MSETEAHLTTDAQTLIVGFLRLADVVVGVIAALLAYWLQFGWQVREGLFYALVLAAPLVPVIDCLRPGETFRWPGRVEV